MKSKYIVTFEHYVPETFEVEIEAETEEDALELWESLPFKNVDTDQPVKLDDSVFSIIKVEKTS